MSAAKHISFFTFLFLLCSSLGKAQFGPAQDLGAYDEDLHTAAAGDLDGDGDIDLVSYSDDQQKLAWYENRDQNSFYKQEVISTAIAVVRDIEIGDMDLDGDLDIVVVRYDPGAIYWFENQGEGQFSGPQVVTTSIGYSSHLALGDMDGDGDLDIVTNNVPSPRTVWIENLGGGSFSGIEEIDSETWNIRAVEIVDLDGDGDNDVLTRAENNDNPTPSTGFQMMATETLEPAKS